MTAVADYRALLDVVLDALDVPPPATVGDEAAYYALVERRAGEVRRVTRGVLEGNDPGGEALYLVDRLTELPASGYRHLAAVDDLDGDCE